MKGVIHWVSALHAHEVDIRLYDRLFEHASPEVAGGTKDFREFLNPNSLRTLTSSYVEPSLGQATPDEHFQFEREGYFCRDTGTTAGGKAIYNRTVTLRDTWAKIEGRRGTP